MKLTKYKILFNSWTKKRPEIVKLSSPPEYEMGREGYRVVGPCIRKKIKIKIIPTGTYHGQHTQISAPMKRAGYDFVLCDEGGDLICYAKTKAHAKSLKNKLK